VSSMIVFGLGCLHLGAVRDRDGPEDADIPLPETLLRFLVLG